MIHTTNDSFPMIERTLRASYRFHRSLGKFLLLFAVTNILVAVTIWDYARAVGKGHAPFIAAALAVACIVAAIVVYRRAAHFARLHQSYFPSLHLE